MLSYFLPSHLLCIDYPVTQPVPDHFWKFRSNSNTAYCLSVCTDAAGSTCQPSNFDTAQKKLVVFDANCDISSPGDGAQLW